MVAKEAVPPPSQARPSAATKAGARKGGKGRGKWGKQDGKASSSLQQQQHGQGALADEGERAGWAGRMSNVKLLAGGKCGTMNVCGCRFL